jgi:hypothetical protein
LRRSAFMRVYSFFRAPRRRTVAVGAGTAGRTSVGKRGSFIMVRHPSATPRRSGENTGQGGRPTDRTTPGGDPGPGDTADLRNMLCNPYAVSGVGLKSTTCGPNSQSHLRFAPILGTTCLGELPQVAGCRAGFPKGRRQLAQSLEMTFIATRGHTSAMRRSGRLGGGP